MSNGQYYRIRVYNGTSNPQITASVINADVNGEYTTYTTINPHYIPENYFTIYSGGYGYRIDTGAVSHSSFYLASINGRETYGVDNIELYDNETIVPSDFPTYKMKTAIGGYKTVQSGGEPQTFFTEDTNSYKTANEPLFNYVGGAVQLAADLGIPNAGDTITGCNVYVDIIDANEELTNLMTFEAVTIGYQGVVSGNPTIYVRANTGSNRISINTQSGMVDKFRAKCYVTSSAYTFDPTSFVRLTIQTPSADIVTYHPLDGHFIGIDSSTMGYDEVNNQIYALPQLPSAPVADGNYVLKATVSNGEVTYSWVLEE